MEAAFSTSNQGYPLKEAYILDSGLTTHICNQFQRFTNFRQARPGDFLWAGNSKVEIQGYGSVLVNTTGTNRRQTLRLDNVA
jgi:hypothetical protein